MPKMAIGQHGFMAIFIDTEGNRLALHSRSVSADHESEGDEDRHAPSVVACEDGTRCTNEGHGSW